MRIIEPKVEAVSGVKALLGESVCYVPASDSLVWIDIPGRKLFLTERATGKTQSFALDREPGFVQPYADGQVLIGQGCSILAFDPVTDSSEVVAAIDRDDPTMRTNDAACSNLGTLVVGTMRPGPTRDPDPVGGLHLVGTDGRVADIRPNLSIPNGLAFDPTGKALYWADTPRRRVWRGKLDAEAGSLSSVELFAELPEGLGRPDGAAIDAEGCYWVAAVWGWSLLRYRPDGALDLTVRLPVQRPTKLAFGGADYRTIFVTSASLDLDKPQDQPLAGRLIALDVGIQGLPAPDLIAPRL